jgi:hypothetical protein
VNLLTYRKLGRLGRLGNQLWQIGATVGLARRLQSVKPVFPPWDYQSVFNVPDEWFVYEDELALAIDSPDIAVDLGTPESIGPRHYLQHLPYLLSAEAEIRQAFTPSPKAEAVLDILWAEYELDQLQPPIVAVHVRRGDTLNNPPDTLNPLDASYYFSGILGALNAGANTVAIFTDDPAWARDRLYHAAYKIVSGPQRDVGGYHDRAPNDWSDLLLMARCDMHVISNATYGWWGAWLANREHVWYPEPWFGAKLAPEHEANVFTYPHWTAITAPRSND